MVLDRNPEDLYGPEYTEARKQDGKRIDARVACFDLSFSDPKSVSLLAAGSGPEARAEVQAARHVAIRKVLGWLEQEAVGVRRGHNGIDRFRGSGVTAAAFDHRTSREGDPQWHTHVLVQNATIGPDQRWSALDSRKLYAHAMTADRLYHAALRAELTRRLDVRWRPVDQRSGAAEIEGLHDRNLLQAFSKRRAQVLAQQQEWGHAGIAAGKAAALATRKPKDHSEPEESFYARVASGLAEHGIGPAELEQVCRGGRDQAHQLSLAERARLLDALAGPGGLTAQASTFARRDVLDALAKQLPVAASAEQALADLEELADEFLGSERCWSPWTKGWMNTATRPLNSSPWSVTWSTKSNGAPTSTPRWSPASTSAPPFKPGPAWTPISRRWCARSLATAPGSRWWSATPAPARPTRPAPPSMRSAAPGCR
jgi:conjugative relaxase-like TrwC/TraI family protein